MFQLRFKGTSSELTVLQRMRYEHYQVEVRDFIWQYCR